MTNVASRRAPPSSVNILFRFTPVSYSGGIYRLGMHLDYESTLCEAYNGAGGSQ